MIPEKSSTKITSNINFSDSKEMTISKESLTHIMSLLSNLYSDKVLAVFRETCTNALDSHAEAKQTKKVRVHLPTSLNPVFEVQDWGVGLSDDDIHSLFGSYGASTKRTSNKFNGTLGLGSKAPFTLTNSFSVTSVFGFVKTFYMVHLNESGVGSISKVDSHTTDEHNGVTVSVPMTYTQFNKTQVFKAFYFLQDKIDINFNFSFIEKFHEDKNYSIVTQIDQHCYVLMSGVLYPVEKHNVTQGSGGTLVLHAKNGEVEFTPSRESLKYSEKTSKWLEKNFEVVNHRINEVQALGEGFSTLQELVDYNNSPIVKAFSKISYKVKIKPVASVSLQGKNNSPTLMYYFPTTLDNTFIVDEREFEKLYVEDKNKNRVKNAKLKYLVSIHKKVIVITEDGKFPTEVFSKLEDVKVVYPKRAKTPVLPKSITVFHNSGKPVTIQASNLSKESFVYTHLRSCISRDLYNLLQIHGKTLVYKPSETNNTLVKFLKTLLPVEFEQQVTEYLVLASRYSTVHRVFEVVQNLDREILKTITPDFDKLFKNTKLVYDIFSFIVEHSRESGAVSGGNFAQTKFNELQARAEEERKKVSAFFLKKYPILNSYNYSPDSHDDIVEYIRSKNKGSKP